MKDIIYTPMNLIWTCILLHLIADFYLQGCLANLKQKSWWKDQVKEFIKKNKDLTYAKEEEIWDKYKCDYLMGLLCHSLMWSIFTFIPIMLIVTPNQFTGIIICNTIYHFIVDHFKANVHAISLWNDQISHFWQILGTIIIVYLWLV